VGGARASIVHQAHLVPPGNKGKNKALTQDKGATASFNTEPEGIYLSWLCRFWRQKVWHDFAGFGVRPLRASGGEAAE
jgi:hypothetical protein